MEALPRGGNGNLTSSARSLQDPMHIERRLFTEIGTRQARDGESDRVDQHQPVQDGGRQAGGAVEPDVWGLMQQLGAADQRA